MTDDYKTNVTMVYGNESINNLISPNSMTDDYKTNVTMVYNNKSINNLINLNDELPDFADIAQDIQNRVSCCVRLESMEARLF
jgi:hypothetical protein